MAFIIDYTFFQRELEVPNVDEINSKSLTTLNQFIDEKCSLFMLNALGPFAFNQLKSLLVNGLLPEAISPNAELQKYWRLVNGATYDKDGVTLIWDGLRVVKGSYKTSVLAYYTYYYWLENEVSYMSGVGEAKGNPKGAIMVNSIRRLTETWNDMVALNQGSRSGELPIHSDYGQWDSFTWHGWYYHMGLNGLQQNSNVSLLEYLTDHPLEFTNEYPRTYAIINQLGI